MVDNGGLTPAGAMMEIQKFKGDDGRIYRLSVVVELYDPAKPSSCSLTRAATN